MSVSLDHISVVLLAAGSGSRFGADQPKAFVEVAGKPLFTHALATFDSHPRIDSIVVVAPDDLVAEAERVVNALRFEKVAAIIAGGDSRAASVRNGLEEVKRGTTNAVLVHDAARPCVPVSMIDRAIAALSDDWDAVVPALPVTDTIKQIDAVGAVVKTLSRGELSAVQTPQACRSDQLYEALRTLSSDELAALTDDAQAIELVGGRVRIVLGDPRARKLTTADDLPTIEELLR